MCHGSDICTNDWDEVDSAASAASAYGLITDLVLLLLMIGTMVLVLKKHAAGLKIVWKLLAAMLLIIFLQPILQAAVSNEPSMKKNTGEQVAGLFLQQYPLRCSCQPHTDPPLPCCPVLPNGRQRRVL